MRIFRTTYCYAGLFLGILLAAHTGKALHGHSEAYYDAISRTKAMAQESGSLNDYCTVCHFVFACCLAAEYAAPLPPLLLTIAAVVLPTFRAARISVRFLRLRAPPAAVRPL